MHRVALLGLLLAATACANTDLSFLNPTPVADFDGTGFQKFIADTHTFASNPNLPDSDALNAMRVQAIATPIEPLSTETGTIWPGPPEPIKSLRDLQMESNPTPAPEPRVPISGLPGGSSGTANVAAPKAAPSAAPSSVGGDTVLTNADGSQTIIHPDGRVEFKPAPK